MPKPHAAPGTESKSNDYIVVKQPDGSWRYKHHLIAEIKLGRPLADDERVVFIDKNRRNFDPQNIDIRWKAPTKEYRRRAHLRRRIVETKAKLEELERQLGDLDATMEDGAIADPQEGRGGRSYQE